MCPVCDKLARFESLVIDKLVRQECGRYVGEKPCETICVCLHTDVRLFRTSSQNHIDLGQFCFGCIRTRQLKFIDQTGLCS